MALDQKETPEVQPGVQFTPKRHTGIDFNPLAQGIQGMSRGIYDLGNIRDVQEDVSALIEEGLWEMQKADSDYTHLKGINAANPEEYKKFQERMYKILTHRMQGAKTAKGRLEVRNALNRHRTLIEARSYEWHKNAVDAQETATANAELQHYVESATNTNNILVINEGLAGVEDVAKRDAARLGFDEHQTTAYVNQALSAAIISIMNGAVIKGDYEEAKEKEKLLRDLYSHLMETKEEGESRKQMEREDGGAFAVDAVGVKHGSSALGKKVHEMVDSLRRRETAFELVTKRLAGKGSGLGIQRSLELQEQLMNNDKGVQDLIRKAEQDGVSREELLSVAKQQVADRIKLAEEKADTWRAGYESIWTQQAKAGVLDWETGRFTVRIDGADRTFDSPELYHKYLKERADEGDEAAAQAQKVMWERWHPNESLGSGERIRQNAEFLKYIIDTVNSGVTPGHAQVDQVLEGIRSKRFPPDALERYDKLYTMIANQNKEQRFPKGPVLNATIDFAIRDAFRGFTEKQLDEYFGERTKNAKGLGDREKLAPKIEQIKQRAIIYNMTAGEIITELNNSMTELMIEKAKENQNSFWTTMKRNWGFGWQEKIPAPLETTPKALENFEWENNPNSYFYSNGELKTILQLEREAKARGIDVHSQEFSAMRGMQAKLRTLQGNLTQMVEVYNKTMGTLGRKRQTWKENQPPTTNSSTDYSGEFIGGDNTQGTNTARSAGEVKLGTTRVRSR